MKTFITQRYFTVPCFVGILLVVVTISSAFAEELRIMTYEGTTPVEYLDNLKQFAKAMYNMDLTITVTNLSDPGEFLKALKNKQVDIINGPHNVPKDPRYKFIQGKLIIPIDLNNIPNYNDIIPSLQRADYITENGDVYGVPFAYAPYGLAYNTQALKEPPTSWKIFWDPAYAGKYAIGSAYELNIYITALAMGIDRSQLGQYDAVSSPEFQEKLTTLVKNARDIWIGVDTADKLRGLSFSTAFGFSFTDLKQQGEIWTMAAPQEGSMGAIGNWMLSNTLRDQPQLKRVAEEWLNYVISPDYQLNHLVRKLSTAPTNIAIKSQMTPEEIRTFHLDDLTYFEKKLIPYPVLDNRSRKGFELIWKKAMR